jgi:hypothetical protein
VAEIKVRLMAIEGGGERQGQESKSMKREGRKKEEGRRKKEEGRRKKEEGRRKKEEGRVFFIYFSFVARLLIPLSLFMCTLLFISGWDGTMAA